MVRDVDPDAKVIQTLVLGVVIPEISSTFAGKPGVEEVSPSHRRATHAFRWQFSFANKTCGVCRLDALGGRSNLDVGRLR